MKVGDVIAGPGEHAFGYLQVPPSRSGLNADIPVHLFVGTESGPTLLVQGAVHGNEVIATIGILSFVRKLDPRKVWGAVIAIPVLNRIGFELSDRGNKLDGKDISTLFPGDPRGSISDQIAYVYFEEVIRKASVMIDFHAGGQTAYERFVLYTVEKDPAKPTKIEQKRRKLVVAFGLDSAAFFPPGTFGTSQSEEAIGQTGVVWFMPEIGGGAGWFANGEENVRDVERGIWNTMKAMRMIEGEFEFDNRYCTVYNAVEVLWRPPVEGLYIRRIREYGYKFRAGEVYGTVQDPYTGDTLTRLYTSTEAIVIPDGHEWPTLGATSVAIAGVVDRVEDRAGMDLYVSFG